LLSACQATFKKALKSLNSQSQHIETNNTTESDSEAGLPAFLKSGLACWPFSFWTDFETDRLALAIIIVRNCPRRQADGYFSAADKNFLAGCQTLGRIDLTRYGWHLAFFA